MKLFEIIKEEQNIEEKYKKVAINDITNPYKNLDDFLKGLKEISDQDYTIIKKYINWIINNYTTRFILNFSSLKDILKYLVKYDIIKNKNILPHKFENIDNIKGETELKSLVKYYSEKAEKIDINKNSENDEDVIFFQSNIKIVKPKSFLNFKKYTKDMEIQNIYIDENIIDNNEDLYILIDNNKNEKFVLMFKYRKYVDKNGKEVNIFKLIKEYPYLKEIFKKYNPNFKFFDEDKFDLSKASLKSIIYLYNNKKISIDDIIKNAHNINSPPMQFLTQYLDINDNFIIYLRNTMNDKQFTDFLVSLPKEKLKKISDSLVKKIIINPKFFNSILNKIEDENFVINVLNNTSENNFINIVRENISFFVYKSKITENLSEERKKIIEKIIKENFVSDPQKTIDILGINKRYDLIDKLFTENDINVFFKKDPLNALNIMEHWSIPIEYKNSYIFSEKAGEFLLNEIKNKIKSMNKIKKYQKEEMHRLRKIFYRIYKKRDYFDRKSYLWYEENPNIL